MSYSFFGCLHLRSVYKISSVECFCPGFVVFLFFCSKLMYCRVVHNTPEISIETAALFCFFLTEVVIETLYSYFRGLLTSSCENSESSLLMQLDLPSATSNTTDQRIRYHCRCSVTPPPIQPTNVHSLFWLGWVWWLNIAVIGIHMLPQGRCWWCLVCLSPMNQFYCAELISHHFIVLCCQYIWIAIHVYRTYACHCCGICLL